MIKVLEIFAEPISNGGQESFAIKVVQKMDKTGMQVDFLTPYYCDNDYYKNIIQEFGGKVYAWELPFRPGKSRAFYAKLIQEFLTRHHYDVVHIHSGSISALVYMAKGASRVGVEKIIVHSHSSGVESLKHTILKRVMAPHFRRYATDFCACSITAAEFKYPKDIVEEKCHIIMNGIDTDLYCYNENIRQEMRKQLSITEECFVVGHVGRFSVVKNHVFLVRVFSEIKKKHKNSKLLLIGSGEEEKTIKQVISELDLTEDVIFVGNVNDVYRYLQAMDVFVMPSLYEGFPIVAIEAQGAGLPCILSDSISNQVDITEPVHFINLEETYETWANKVIEYKNYVRQDTREQIITHDCDIGTTAEIIRNIYLGK